MPNFIELQEARNLTTLSDFSEIAQACIEAHYLPPYPNQPDHRQDKQTVNRVFHGGLHAARTAMCAELFLELYNRYAPHLVTNSQGLPLTAQEIKLLKLAALYHDSANTNELKGKPVDHANLFMTDMMALGYSSEFLQPFADAIQYKDADMANKTLYMKIVQSADCLEIIRCLKSNPFKKELLNIHADLYSIPGFIEELDQIIDNHYETIALLEGVEKGKAPLHLECEYSSNCYLTLYKIIENMFISAIVLEAESQHKFLDLQLLDAGEVTLLDLFNRKHSGMKKIILDGTGTSFDEIKKAETHTVMDLFHGNGILFRALDRDKIDSEFETLKDNADVIKRDITNPSGTLRDYVLENKNAPNGLKWRPCTLLKNEIPVSVYKKGKGIGVLIDPRAEAGTILSFFYKKLVYSGTIVMGGFNYKRPRVTRAKDKETLEALSDKMIEQNLRRMGGAIDSKCQYYGKSLLNCSEILGTYLKNGIRGIVAGTDPQDIKDAMILRAKLGEPVRGIYHYFPYKGLLTLIPEHELIQKLQPAMEIPINIFEVQTVELSHIMGLKENILAISQVSEGTDYNLEGEYSDCYGKIYQISFDTRTFSDDAIQKIVDYFKTISAELKSNEESTIENPIALQYNYKEEQSLLSFHIHFINTGNEHQKSYFKEEVQEHLKSITHILKKIQITENNDVIIVNNDSQSEIYLIAHTVEEVRKAHFESVITQHPAIEDVSLRNPLKYSFVHPADHVTQCVCYVKNGTPVIEFHFPSGEVRTEETDLLPEIARKYFQRALVKLTDQINQLDIKSALAKIGILNLSIQLVESNLFVEYQAMPGLDKDTAKNQLLLLLGLPVAKEINHDYISRYAVSKQSDVFFSLPEVQKIETFTNCFKRLAETAALKSEPQREEKIAITGVEEKHVDPNQMEEMREIFMDQTWRLIETVDDFNNTMNSYDEPQKKVFYEKCQLKLVEIIKKPADWAAVSSLSKDQKQDLENMALIVTLDKHLIERSHRIVKLNLFAKNTEQNKIDAVDALKKSIVTNQPLDQVHLTALLDSELSKDISKYLAIYQPGVKIRDFLNAKTALPFSKGVRKE